MLRVGICDDDRNFVKSLRNEIVTACFSYEEIQITEFYDGREIVDKIVQGKLDIDLLILDIYMKDINGMNTALFIRDQLVDVDIIFCTKSTKHILEGYRYKAFAYWLKPINPERIQKDMQRYCTDRNNTSEFLHVAVRGSEIKIELDRVYYFSSDGRKVIAKLKNEAIEFYGKLTEIEKQVGEKQFIRCHQSYLVNKKHIKKQSKNLIDVGLTETVPVSRKYGSKLNVTRSLVMNQESTGTIIFTKGIHTGKSQRLERGKVITLGTDETVCDYVIEPKDEGKVYCEIWYDQKEKDYVVKMQEDNICSFNGNELCKELEYHIFPCSNIQTIDGKNIIAFR